MKKIISKVLLLTLISTMLISFTSCSDDFNDKWENMWKSRESTTEATTILAKTPMPETPEATLIYFNNIVNRIKSVNPGLKFAISKDVKDFESENAYLKSSVATIKKLMFKKDEKKFDYGTKLLDEIPIKGQSYISALSMDDITEAKCIIPINEDKPSETDYEINITLKDDEVNERLHASKVFEFTAKEDILKEFQKAVSYLIVSDYNIKYTASTIRCVVDKKTDQIKEVEFVKNGAVSTSVTGAGELTSVGEVECNFLYVEKVKLNDFVWDDPNAPETTTAAAK